MAHANYPHVPGAVHDCDSCQSTHYYENDVHCQFKKTRDAEREELLTELGRVLMRQKGNPR